MEVRVVRVGLYRIETIDKRTALLTPIEEGNEKYAFPVESFGHDASEGDVIQVWREGTQWKTKYLEEETKSATSHIKDFAKRMMDQD